MAPGPRARGRAPPHLHTTAPARHASIDVWLAGRPASCDTRDMSRAPAATWFFALVVVRRGDRFLLVHERKHGQTWYLPAGRVEPGETLADAALRETLEETGVKVALEGILRVEHDPGLEATRVRVFYLARPLGDETPKQAPDEHSLAARWVTLPELQQLPLRGQEVLEIFAAVAAGAPVAPLNLIVQEGAPWLP
jgi:8-oxo-dGTP pyrophosphatase MutT (NUDIX family)